MMQTSTAPIWTAPVKRLRSINPASFGFMHQDRALRLTKGIGGFVLVEMLMVVGLIALMASVAMISFGSMWGNLRFKRQADELVNIFQMAQNAAGQSDRRYEILIDLSEQACILREFIGFEDITGFLEEDSIIQRKDFSEALTLDYVFFDDVRPSEDNLAIAPEDEGVKTVVRFLAGKSGWQFGGIIVLLDRDGNPWTLVIRRFAAGPELLEGEWDLDSLGMTPQYKEDVSF